MRIDGPISMLKSLVEHLKKKSSAYVIGHEVSKKSKKEHYHIHVEHKITRDTLRRYFRKQFPNSKQMGLYIGEIKTNTQKNIDYCIKGKKVHCSDEQAFEAYLKQSAINIEKFNRQKGMTLIQKATEYITNTLSHTTDSNAYLLDKGNILLHTLKWFKQEKLTYPTRQWMHKFYVHILMENELAEQAVLEYTFVKLT